LTTIWKLLRLDDFIGDSRNHKMKYPELLDSNGAASRDIVLDKMRRDDPIYWCNHESIRAWFVTRYDDVLTFFKDHRLEFGSVRAELLKQSKKEQDELQSFIVAMENLLTAMPRERQKKMQKLLLEFLSMRVLKTFKDDIGKIIDKALDSFSNESEINIVERFAYPIPAYVIASLLGIPRQDWDKFIDWTSALNAIFWPYDYERYRKADSAMTNMMEYFKDLMPKAMESNKESLTAKFGEAVKCGDISEGEALSNCATLMFAGHETTATAISSGVCLLFEHPGLLDVLRADPSLIPKATQEILRYKPIVGWMRRTATVDFEFKGKCIKRNDVIYLGTYAANRDPEVVQDPHQFNIHRELKKPSLTFGVGRHFCLGAALAQMEVELTLTALINRFPNMHLDLNRVKRKPAMMLMDAINNLPLSLSSS